jgi:hypothetical protein
MEKVLSITTFERDRSSKSALAYWLSRPPEERIAEVERLRREYLTAIRGNADGSPEGLLRTLALIECPWR